MKKFEQAYLKFLKKYTNEDWYEGAILCGSYATGNNNENSDIDIYIVANNSIDWRERGNILVDDFIIEYFINPIKKIESYFEVEKNSFDRHTLAMFNQAIVIEDKNGKVKDFISLAKNLLKIKPEVSEYTYLMNCYSVWERFDELENKFKSGQDIDLSFYIFLDKAISTLSYNKGIGSFSINKLEKFINDKEFLKRYGVENFFNKFDESLINKCLIEKDRESKYQNAKTLYEHICQEFNFDINNFVLKSKI